MQSKPQIINPGLDWISIFLYLSLVFIGWLMVYSVYYSPKDTYNFLDLSTEMGRQTLWVLISLIAFVASLYLDWKFWNTFAIFFYAIGLLGLILVLIYGKEVNGAKAWLQIGGYSFQPVEFAKLGTILALSSYLSFHKGDLKNSRSIWISIGIFVLPMILILLQPDPGSALVFLSFFIILYKKGLNPSYYILAFILLAIFLLTLIYDSLTVLLIVSFVGYGIFLQGFGLNIRNILIFIATVITTFIIFKFLGIFFAFIPIAFALAICIFILVKNRTFGIMVLMLPAMALALGISYLTSFIFNQVLKPHQQERINVWLRPDKCDPRGSLYNLRQSKMAIGSGGLQGKGFLNGDMAKLKYVPEQDTDFIFSIIGEEQGFIGSIGIIFLFTLLVIRLIIIAERSRFEFIQVFVYGVAGFIFFHYFINIGMTMGVMPVIGIPLPFISRGGTSLLIFSIMVAIALRMDLARQRGS